MKVDEYIERTKDELVKDFAEFKTNNEFASVHHEYLWLEDFCKRWCGYKLDNNGNAVSTYNPQAFWDWYEIGGRWSGKLTGNIKCNFDGVSYSALELYIIQRMPHHIKNNSISINNLLLRYMNNKEEYKILLCDNTDYKTTLEDHINDYAISIDYHD